MVCLSFGRVLLVAPYCAVPQDYLSETPLLRAMGFLVSQHGQLGAIPPPLFLSVSPLESIREVEVRYPPPQKGYLSDTCAIPYENRAKWVRYPSLRYYLERALHAIGRGGDSRIGPLCHVLLPDGDGSDAVKQKMKEALEAAASSIWQLRDSERRVHRSLDGPIGANHFRAPQLFSDFLI